MLHLKVLWLPLQVLCKLNLLITSRTWPMHVALEKQQESLEVRKHMSHSGRVSILPCLSTCSKPPVSIPRRKPQAPPFSHSVVWSQLLQNQLVCSALFGAWQPAWHRPAPAAHSLRLSLCFKVLFLLQEVGVPVSTFRHL